MSALALLASEASAGDSDSDLIAIDDRIVAIVDRYLATEGVDCAAICQALPPSLEERAAPSWYLDRLTDPATLARWRAGWRLREAIWARVKLAVTKGVRS